MRLSFLLYFLCLSVGAQAQSKISNRGFFRVDEVKGCAPLTIIFTGLAPGYCQDGVAPCVIDKDGDKINDFTSSNIPDPLNFPITYTTPGTFKLIVGVQSGVGNDTLTITVFPNNQPNFDLYSCANDGVQVRVTDTQYDRYQITYSDGTVTTVPKGSLGRHNHTFASSGNFNVSVRGLVLNNDGSIAKNNCTDATKSFTAIPSLSQPFITEVETVNDTDINVEYNLAANTLARLEIATNNNTGFQPLRNIYNDNQTTVNNLSNNSSFYCFRTTLIDACTNTLASSQPVCSIVLTAQANDGVNNLNWQSNSNGVTSHSISKNAIGINGLSPAINAFADVDVICKETYTYSVAANYPQAVSRSLPKTVISFNTQPPPSIENISASFGGSVFPTISWPSASVPVYTLFKAVNGNPSVFLLETNGTSIPDNTFDINNPSCYFIRYENECDALSALTTAACPIILSGTQDNQNNVTLTWSAYSGYTNGLINYRIEKYDNNGGLLDQFNVGLTQTFTDPDDNVSQVNVYRVFGIAADNGLVPVTSNDLRIVKSPNIYYPRAFTPNNDNLNDTFRVYGKYIREFRMNIFNRWGELVFTSANIDDVWDGTFRGKTQPEGTYVFSAEIVDEAGRTSTRSGSIVLLSRD
ncbi:MAG: gliding motility-associated C-terminal domain-containing protein [Cyclobacteriaceae bacterium]|jgi:gliding motility-associated-like protein|nr:gliding motility-associated C-terminal domain-containing protein [Cyclobacteriaceae bacterium]